MNRPTLRDRLRRAPAVRVLLVCPGASRAGLRVAEVPAEALEAVARPGG